jgi:hypothetical protein
MTRGIDLVKSDIRRASGEPPLITAPFYLCQTDLLMLLLIGEAYGNISGI